VTIFGVDWNDLTLEHVRQFLEDAGPEPLLWEAKGGKVTRHEIRAQICGFANSHDGGFLMLGADEVAGTWKLDGIRLGADPPTWISDLAGNQGVVPYPEGLDSRAWKVDDERSVVVVRIPPIAAPPCNTYGTVYERVSGKTIPVREPLRLSALFDRGDQARRTAHNIAEREAANAFRRSANQPGYAVQHIQLGLGLAAAGYDADQGVHVFRQSFEVAAQAAVEAIVDVDQYGASRGLVGWDTTQDSRTITIRPGHQMGDWWSVRITRDGGVGVQWRQEVINTHIETLVEHTVRRAWRIGDEIISALGAQDSRFLCLISAGGMLPPHRGDSYTETTVLDSFPTVALGPLTSGIDDAVLAGIERDLMRSLNQMAYEPEPDDEGPRNA
jgi:hypothetical protein